MLVQRVRAEQPKASGPARIETVTLPLSGKAYKSFKLLLRQVGMLPQWHPGKGQRGWVFVDEVFFDQGRLPN
jgi:hypothetical protein